ncbi:DUF805 domain-containing protein [Rhizobium sp. P38BS-XIX]|uniref:DUF805 domain-containing protein n=1 Tax=Rhizobium sp. P38BS-XIX TaxID=2726740 RepID=UPI00145777D5|nr:DUF805 domain-containing protein [Rhizobium sp. P38BS-XIX]NLR96509.1 DUF805 domain-containing protein [Rhizobium sp. P38BS-XIX]
MIEVLFCFQGRLTRGQYLLWRLAISAVGGIVLVLLFSVMAFASHGKPVFSSPLAFLPFMLLFAPFLWMDLSLQAARIRDLGIRSRGVALLLLSTYVAVTVSWLLMPAASMSTALQEVYRALGMFYCVLLLWTRSDFFTHAGTDDSKAVPQQTPTAYAAPARTTAAGKRASFGQRGLKS